MNIELKRFVHADAMRVTGLDSATIQNWVNRGLLDRSGKKSGQGQRRLYSARELLKLALMRELAKQGIAVSEGSDICAVLFNQVPWESNPNWALIRRGRATITQAFSTFAILDGRPDFGPDTEEVWVLVPMGGIKRGVLSRLEEIDKARA